MKVTRKLCEAVKARFKNELNTCMSRSLLTGNEVGFPLCRLDANHYNAGPLVQGNQSSVNIPPCGEGELLGFVHSHSINPAVQFRFGSELAHRFYSGPSLVDLESATKAGFGCASTSRTLTCYGGTTKNLDHLKQQQVIVNEDFQAWGHGSLSDSEFEKSIRRTVKEQELAMNRGGFCRVSLKA